ncbi:hypothetical protein D3C79_1062320 [compost metagenome]
MVLAVQVVNVQVVQVHARERRVDGIEDVLAREAAAVGQAVSRAKADLGRHDPVLAMACHGFANDFL